MTKSHLSAVTLKGAAIGILAACLTPFSAMAQTDYPNQPVTMVVPFPAGGTTDILGRIVASALGQQLGQNVIVENRPGAGGNIGSAAASQAAPDGYTLLMGTVGTHAINASLYPDMAFDPVADFTPLSRVAMVPNLLVANPDQPFTTVAEMVAYAQENPDEIFYASSGNGTSIHLAAELFKQQAGIEMEHIPFAGSAQAMIGLVANEVGVMFDNLPSSIQHVRSGALRPIAVTSAERSQALPDIPTIAESGFPGFEAASWFGLFVPANTPDPIVERLNEAIVTLLEDPAVIERFAEQGAVAHSETSQEFATFIESESAKWGEIVEISGATVD
ncbi:tripartite tricarboxylate transporter substrate binding protein [Aliihoeflea aestuarii]|jgi:tripartite-type tricarboxylate transporter receptor subunit TctC|uniref:Bug family tripartite tricarboxylate transporter substrate binding protein n=1 Tax=Aliihoeflea aestuarii TaxID=453840 RepID=UPI002093968A|nr:tripartite tricarboxylate transporter substrate binding protein [Aliihoeflea aestuarii]MCO6389865.1 tripartite tricarboxylate transporter substrate binding protein [Aliihoeflea aestuarii]